MAEFKLSDLSDFVEMDLDCMFLASINVHRKPITRPSS